MPGIVDVRGGVQVVSLINLAGASRPRRIALRLGHVYIALELEGKFRRWRR